MQSNRMMGMVVVFLVFGAAGPAGHQGSPSSQGLPSHATLPAPAHQGRHVRLAAGYGQLPLRFEANQGQTDPQVQFLARGRGYTLFLTATEAVLAWQLPPQASPAPLGGPLARAWGPALLARAPQAGHPSSSARAVLRMRLVGANPHPRGQGREALPGRVHSFRGNDPTRWHTHIPTYARVEYPEVYPGISLVYYGSPRQLEYDFMVAPGADPTAITWHFEGAEALAVERQGDLVLQVAGGEVRLGQPRVYQERDGVRQAIAGHWVRTGPQEVGLHVGAYAMARALLIDPVLRFSTYLGGSGDDAGDGIAVDGAGYVYVTGRTASPDFPTANPVQPGYGGGPLYGDVFVAKLTPDGTALVYATYLGGSHDDWGYSVAADAAGHAYVTGYTNSPDFPTAHALQPVFGGSSDAFVVKLTPEGSALIFSTYLGGSRDDLAKGIAVDADGNAYVAGWTFSADFPTAKPLQETYGGQLDAFVAKVDSAGSALIYSTYLGGSGEDPAQGIAVDAMGSAYVTGFTHSPDFPTVHPLQPVCARCPQFADAFVAKVNPEGSAVVYATYLGGRDGDFGEGIAVDELGQASVTGYTQSKNFPTMHPLQPLFGGGSDVGSDAFVAKLNPQGTGLLYATYLGGSDTETPRGIAVDAAGHAYVTGLTASRDFPTLHPVQAVFGGDADVFVAKLTPEGSALVYATYLGGRDIDDGYSIAVDAEGYASVTGWTASKDFPTVHPLQATFGGGSSIGADAFVARLTPEGSALVYATYLGGHDDDLGSGIAVDAAGYAYVTGLTKSRDFPLANPLQPTHGGSVRDAFVAKLRPDGSALVYATYLGGLRDDYGHAIAVDVRGDVYVTGGTESDDFPTLHPLQPALGGDPFYPDAFIAKLSHAPAPEIVVEPLSVMFGAVRVGQSRTGQVILRNGGEAELMVSAITGVALPFALLGPLLPLSLDPGETIAVEVRFTPTQPGKAQQSLRIHSTDPDEPEVAVTLQGRGWGRRGP